MQRMVDWLIAKHVMKWREEPGPKFDADGPCEWHMVLLPPTLFTGSFEYPPRGIIPPWYWCRRWSGSEDCWQVVNRMTMLDYQFHLMRAPDLNKYICQFFQLGPPPVGRARRPEMAICLGALKAIRYEARMHERPNK